MGQIEHAETVEDATRMADRLRAPVRERAVVAISVARATRRAYVDLPRLMAEVGDDVDVWVLQPEAGRTLRELVHDVRHVYGGAARVLAPTHTGAPPLSTPLRVPFGPGDVANMTNTLIEDVRTVTGPSAPTPS